MTPLTPRQYGFSQFPFSGNSWDSRPPILPPNPKAGKSLSLFKRKKRRVGEKRGEGKEGRVEGDRRG